MVFSQSYSMCTPYNITSSISESKRLLVRGCTEFGFSLLRSLNNQIDDSIGGTFISPFSIWSALLIVYYGSGSTTQSELEMVLGIEKLNKLEVREIQKSLIRDNPSYSLANRMYLQYGLELVTCLLDLENIGYADFLNDPEHARQLINRWIEKNTMEKIKSILPPSSVDSNTQLVLANAVYFHAIWSLPFDPNKTKPRIFRVSLGEEIIVQMMSATGRYMYATIEELQCSILELPYGEMRDISLIILLPNHLYFGLKVLDRVLTSDSLYKLRRKLRHRDVQVELPKFRLDPSYDLKNALKSIGLRQVFQKGEADFSNLFANYANLAIDQIRHTAAIEVTENGTTAAASTVLQFISRIGQIALPINFIVDRPFFFFIFDKATEMTLFMGHVWHPIY